MVTTTERTKNYLKEHPSIKDCLKMGVINYSKLARRIGKELTLDKKTSMEAILVACRRYAEELKREEIFEEKILGILRKSELEIKNKIVVIIIDKQIHKDSLMALERTIRKSGDACYFIEGVNAYTLIFAEKFLESLEPQYKKYIIKKTNRLALITLRSPSTLENTPGVMGHLFTTLADHGINIVETMSCWTDTMFVIAEEDVGRAMESLRFS